MYYYKHPLDGSVYSIKAIASFKSEHRYTPFKIDKLIHHGFITSPRLVLGSFIRLTRLQCSNIFETADKALINTFYEMVQKGMNVIEFDKKIKLVTELSELLVKNPDEYYKRLTEIETSKKFEAVKKITYEMLQ